MPDRFPVPLAYAQRDGSTANAEWCARLPGVAEELADRWGLTPDGPPWSGFLSVVWPVRRDDGRRLALKVHDGSPGTDGERAALGTAARHGERGLVELVEADPERGALLLRRLDAGRTLLGASVDAAGAVLGDLVAGISRLPAPGGLRSVLDVVDHLRASIEGRAATGVVPPDQVARALETLGDESARAADRPTLVHGDLHYENVLHTLPGEPPAWVAIDPLPFAGAPEWELRPVVRNRWPEAVATGDPDRELRRRVDTVAERATLDRERTRRIVQASSVHLLMWLATEDVTNPVARSFRAPSEVVARW